LFQEIRFIQTLRIVMKWSYIISFAAGILFFTLLTWSLWWLAGGAAVLVGVWIYQLLAERRYIRVVKTATLENQVRDLQVRLDKSVLREQQLTRAADQATTAKKQLLATLNQEIRTPVNGMAGMASLLTGASLTDQQREYVNGIQHCGEQLVAVVNHILVDDLLNTSLAATEDSQPQEERLDLRRTVRDVLDLFEGRLASAGVVLSSHIDEQVPHQLAGDGGKIKQILINLVDNAAKHTSQGKIRVDARVLQIKEDGKVELGVEVHDTGSGIPASRIGRIFEGLSPVVPSMPATTATGAANATTATGVATPATPATTNVGADRSVNGASKNPGLGLVVCRRLVEMMDGAIAVHSEPGAGCTFSFQVWTNAVDAQPSRQPVSPAVHEPVLSDEVRSLALKL
jgi:signal transduction histidine kinase